jgi:hypothetical protein
MALDATSTLVVDAGNFFTATYNDATPEALPADLSAPGANWVNVGHTSLDDIFSISSEGGDSNQIGSLQNQTLRTIYSPRTESFNFTIQQFDAASLKLYYGSNAVVSAGPPATVKVPEKATPTTCSFLAVFTDGEKEFAFYVPKAEIFRADDMAIQDTESLAGLPLSVKPLKHGTNAHLYEVTTLGA